MKEKKHFIGFVHKLLLTAIFATAFTATAFAKDQGSINGDDVNVRSGPTLDSSIFFKLNTGQQVDVVGINGNYFVINGYGAENAYVASEFINIVQANGTINDNAVNIRNLPTTEGSQVVGQASVGDIFTVVGQTGEWYIVNYNGSESYIKKDFLNGDLLTFTKQKNPIQSAQPQQADIVTMIQDAQVIQPQPMVQSLQAPVQGTDVVYGIVSSDTGLNLREAPTTDADVIFALPYDAVVDVLNVGEEWIMSSYDGQVGYLSAEFLAVRTGQKPIRSQNSSSLAEEVLAYAKRFLGTPYRWAGTNLNTGVDCSGFVYSVMKHFGITLNRSSRDMSHNGYVVSKSELQAGDLVFFDTDSGVAGNISHVGIYMGGGQFIHSASPNLKGVSINGLGEDYYTRNYVTACRVLN